MSANNIATAPAAAIADKAVYIPATARKPLQAQDFAALAARVIVGGDTALIKPSDIRTPVAVLKAGMGAKPTPETFVTGLAGIAARLAWGAIKPEQAADGLPDFAAWAIHECRRRIIGTQGITAGLLRIVVADVATATAALPIKPKAETKTAPAKIGAPAPAPAPEEAETAAADAAHRRAQQIDAMRRNAAQAERAGILLDFAQHSARLAAQVEARRMSAAHRASTLRDAIMSADESILRELLAERGFTLAKKRTAKAA